MHKSVFRDTFRALRHRNYRLWFVGQGVSLVGTWMQTVAQQVLVYSLTGSAAALGIVNFIGFIPLIPFSIWSGSLSDRYSKRTIILICQVLMMVEAFVLGILAWTGAVQTWHVYVLSFFVGAVTAVDLPARQAFTVDLVEGKEDLTNAIGLNSAMFNLARALGPALAGMLVALTGAGPAFVFNGITFVAVIISLVFMRNLPQSSHPVGRGTGMIQHMAEGFRYVRGTPVLVLLFSLIAVSAFLSMPYSTLMPVFAEEILAESAQPVIAFVCEGPSRLFTCQSPQALPLGMLFTAVGIGALVGALLVAALPDNSRRGVWLTIGNLGFPIMLILLAVSRSFVLSLLLVTAAGWLFVWQNALANTLLQIATPDEVRGRVMALYTMVFQSMMRMGALQAGFSADWIGAPLALAAGSVLALIYGAWVAVFKPAVRRL